LRIHVGSNQRLLMPVENSGGYRALIVQIRGPVPFKKHLFLKPHRAESDSLPKERTLFVAGIPAGLGDVDLVELFSAFGGVERAAIHGSKVLLVR
jgi:hypothetical protein